MSEMNAMIAWYTQCILPQMFSNSKSEEVDENIIYAPAKPPI